MSKQPNLCGIRDILVGIAAVGDDQPCASVGYGLTLAKAAGAHLTVQSASWHLTGDDAWLGTFEDGWVAAEDRRLDAFATAVAERAAGDAAMAGVACSTQTPRLTYPEIVDRLVSQARLFDLTVLDAAPASYDVDRERIEKVLFGSGRPVLVVPPGHSAFAARHVMVAWDGSAQAARAVHDAMPFLQAAETIEVACVVGERDLPNNLAGAEIAPHLARHGAAVTVTDLPIWESVADTLRQTAGRGRADLMVLGAYGHSRLRERIFGGVTQALLRHCPVPMMLSH